MLSFLAARATPGVEAVVGERYLRSISVNGHEGYFEVSHDAQQKCLLVRVQIADPTALYLVVERIRSLFDLNADWPTIAKHLKSDAYMADRLSASPGLRVPGSWDGFELAVRAILGQQISVPAATALAGRLVQTHGEPLEHTNGVTHLFPTAERLASASREQFPMPSKRAETIRALARAVCEGKITFSRVGNAEEFSEDLQSIPGIGRWTAQYIAMRALGEPDAFPSGDLSLQRTLRAKNHAELESHAEAWRPWRAYATMYLWTDPRH